MIPIFSEPPPRLRVAAPLFESAEELLFCLSCSDEGHVCLAEIPPLDGDRPVRLVLERRGGALFHCPPELVHASTPFSMPFGPLCGGCGCALRAACPDGCWWTEHTRRLRLPDGRSLRFPLCSRCAPPAMAW